MTAFYVKVDRVPGMRGFGSYAEAERAASTYQTPKHLHDTIRILNQDGRTLRSYRHTMGDDGWAAWHIMEGEDE